MVNECEEGPRRLHEPLLRKRAGQTASLAQPGPRPHFGDLRNGVMADRAAR